MKAIVPFIPVYQDSLIELILSIQQREFGIAIGLHDQPDLLDISGFYQHGLGNFWLALHDGVVIGSIALLDIGNDRVVLRKMFVAAPYRAKSHGVAQHLLDELLDWCELKQVREIYLETSAHFVADQRFYRRNGFNEVAKAELPTRFPLMAMDSVFFARDLSVDKYAGQSCVESLSPVRIEIV